MDYLDKVKNDYIQKLLINHNDGAQEDQKDLVDISLYDQIISEVTDLIRKYPDDTPEELRDRLYKTSGIEDAVRNFIVTRKIAPSLSVTYGTPLYKESVSIGSDFGSDTIYDLASITKIFTGVSIMKLASIGALDLNTKIKDILPEYKNIEDTTVYDLLTFRVPLMTLQRVDAAANSEEGKKALETATVQHNFTGKNAYNDMGAMILKYVIEKVTNMDFYDFVKENFLDVAGMNSTFVAVPDKDKQRLVRTDGSISFINNDVIKINDGYEFGLPNDPKARIMESSGPNLSGHAGLFSTTKDIGDFCISLIKFTTLNPEAVLNLSQNVTGGRHVMNSEHVMNQYFGKMVYSKNPSPVNSEVRHELSGRAIGGAGFTGNKFMCDPINELYTSFCCNRTYDRVVQIPGFITRKQEIIDGAHYIELPDGSMKLCGTDYVYGADDITAPADRLAMQYKFLEDFFSLTEYSEKEHIL